MTLSNDTCNDAPTLADMCAQCVAENGQTIFGAKNADLSKFCGDDDECVEMRMSNDDVILPVPVSEKLFDAFRRVRVANEDDDKDVLEFFTDARRTPLWNMNLDGSQVTDKILNVLLREHGLNLLSLNLTECNELTEIVNYLVRDLLTPKLQTLNLGSLIKIFGPWLTTGDDDNNVHSDSLESAAEPSATTDQESEYRMEELNLTENVVTLEVGEEALTDDYIDANYHHLKHKPSTSSSVDKPRPILTNMCPNLLKFTLHGDVLDDILPNAETPVKERLIKEFFTVLMQPLNNLRDMDLSYWSSLNDLSFLRGLNLHCLILYEVPDLYKAVEVICSIKSLEYLDISQSSPETGMYPLPATTLDRIVCNLPNLVSLDITMTNLASNPTKGDWPPLRRGLVESDIVGLCGLNKKLEFLGIFLCDSASHYQRIPAVKVAGDGTEQQILAAIEKYLHRPTLLVNVLNEAYQTYRFGVSLQHTRALHLMLESMSVHLFNANIQIASSASIFYIIRNVQMNRITKKLVIAALLNAMQHHMQEQTLVRNCCLSLCQFEVPGDILHDYERAVRLLLRVLQLFNDHMTQRIVIYLLNSLACHVDGQQKISVGNLGAVEVILEGISRRVDGNLCDEVMEVSWSFLWNITDETPLNCSRFLNNGGMELFQKCNDKFPTKVRLLRNMMGLLIAEPIMLSQYDKFHDRTELLRNMMGLMGNIAEVKHLRCYLMKSCYVKVFCELLNNIADGIEISYNSAGVLAHMISDGEEAWTCDEPSRQAAGNSIVQAVRTWQLNAKRFINYRSFEPILRLLPLENSYASQYWAVWALANLTTVDGAKYCGFIVDEKGVPLLLALVSNPTTDATLCDLAKRVLTNVQEYKGLSLL